MGILQPWNGKASYSYIRQKLQGMYRAPDLLPQYFPTFAEMMRHACEEHGNRLNLRYSFLIYLACVAIAVQLQELSMTMPSLSLSLSNK